MDENKIKDNVKETLKEEVRNAYLEIRKTNSSISDNILNLMYNAAIEKIERN